MNFNQVNYKMRRLVSGPSLTKEARLPCQSSSCGMVAKVALRQVLLQVIQFSAVNYHSTIAPYPFIMWGWTMGPLKATVAQRHCLIPPQRNKKKQCAL